MRLYIIRHGQPDYAADRLTPRGRAEAEALADYLPRLGLTALYCSPLGRARETCMACAGRLGLPVTELDWARELTGVYYQLEGFGKAAPFTVPGEVMYRLRPTPDYEGWEKGAYFDDPRLHAQVRRMEQGSDNLLARYGYVREGAVYRVAGQAEGERIAVFCHQGIAATWISYLLHMPYQAGWAGLWQACTSVTEITMERRSAGYAVPRMLKMGSTAHLELAGLDSDEFGLAVNVTG